MSARQTMHTVDVQLDEIERNRAENYDVLSLLLSAAPTAEVLQLLSSLTYDDSSLGQGWAALSLAASTAKVDAVAREHFDLFTGVGRGELLPYASFYITGFLHERPLAEIRGDLARLGIARQENDHEPEDRIALLCAVMAAFARGELPGADSAADAPDEATFFARHLAPWAALFFEDLDQAPAADFYRHLARVGRAFIATEYQAFALAANERQQTNREDAT